MASTGDGVAATRVAAAADAKASFFRASCVSAMSCRGVLSHWMDCHGGRGGGTASACASVACITRQASGGQVGR